MLGVLGDWLLRTLPRRNWLAARRFRGRHHTTGYYHLQTLLNRHVQEYDILSRQE